VAAAATRAIWLATTGNQKVPQAGLALPRRESPGLADLARTCCPGVALLAAARSLPRARKGGQDVGHIAGPDSTPHTLVQAGQSGQ